MEPMSTSVNIGVKNEVFDISVILSENFLDDEFKLECQLCSRVFQVPYVALNIIDKERVWCKESIGSTFPSCPLESSVYATSLSQIDCPIQIITDLSIHPLLYNNNLVTQDPFIKFYASSAIYLNDSIVALLCIYDSKVRSDFSITNQIIFKDIANIIEKSLKQKVEIFIQKQERSHLMLALGHHLRTPLTSLLMSLTLLHTDIKTLEEKYTQTQLQHNIISNNTNTTNNTAAISNTNTTHAIHNIMESMKDVNHVTSQLGFMVETGLQIDRTLTTEKSKSLCDMNAIICKARALVNSLHVSCEVNWHIEDLGLGLGPHFTYPETFFLLLIMSISRFINVAHSLDVFISYQPSLLKVPLKERNTSTSSSTSCSSSSSGKHMEHISSYSEGFLSVSIHVIKEKENFAELFDEIRIWFEDSQIASTSTSTIGISCNIECIQVTKAFPLSTKNLENFHSNNTTTTNNNNNNNTIISRSNSIEIVVKQEGKTKRSSSLQVDSNNEIIEPLKSATSTPTSASCHQTSTSPRSFHKPASLLALQEIVSVFEGKDLDLDTVSSIHSIDKKERRNSFVEDSDSQKSKRDLLSHQMSLRLHSKSCNHLNTLLENNVNGTYRDMKTSPVSVLVVEDSVSVQKILARYLISEGCIVNTASNGKIGLEMMISSPYDVVFMDFLMPIMGGITAMQLYQKWIDDQSEEDDLLRQDMLIVGMSATASAQEQEDAFRAGMHLYCPKPLDMSILHSILLAKQRCGNSTNTATTSGAGLQMHSPTLLMTTESHSPFSLDNNKHTATHAHAHTQMSPIHPHPITAIELPRRGFFFNAIRNALKRIRFAAGLDI
eukprot:gene3139-6178_t